MIYLSPFGPLTILEKDGFLTTVCLGNKEEADSVPNPVLTQAACELDEYFAGKRTVFDVPLNPGGTLFQRKVWAELLKIPYGTTISYGELARCVGQPKAARAVGMANHRNPLMIFIPCHRVIGADGSLTGYAGGVEAKRFLLELEQTSAGKKGLFAEKRD